MIRIMVSELRSIFFSNSEKMLNLKKS